jgi:DNA-binding response OmpR family regulator
MGARILVVDDEPDLLELVRLTLDQAGHQVETAASGRSSSASRSAARTLRPWRGGRTP